MITKIDAGFTLNVINMFTQGIIDSTRTETRQTFSRMFVIAKYFEELLAITLNGITVNVQYVFSTPVILGAILNY